MCELFGVTANRQVKINELLKLFFGHSNEHKNEGRIRKKNQVST